MMRIPILLVLATLLAVARADKFKYADKTEAENYARQFKDALTKADNQGFDQIFTEYKGKYGKSYRSSQDEGSARNAFRTNLQLITSVNLNNNSDLVFDTNQFADMTWDQFQKTVLMTPQRMPPNPYVTVQPDTPPGGSGSGGTVGDDTKGSNRNRKLLQFSSMKSIDWVAKGKVTSVKNQGSCGNCWAMAGTAAIESALLIAAANASATATATGIDLSEQEITQCVGGYFGYYNSLACISGQVPDVFDYAGKYNITGESKMPYAAGSTGFAGACIPELIYIPANNPVTRLYATPSQGASVPRNATELWKALSVRPVVVYINLNNGFQFYSSGVYPYASCPASGDGYTNHALLVTGYKPAATVCVSRRSCTTTPAHWIMKQSWGTGFGMSGYVKLESRSGGDGSCNMYVNGGMYPIPGTLPKPIVYPS